MSQIKKIFINTTWGCNMDCPRCYIPKALRDDHASRLGVQYLTKVLRHQSIGQGSDTVVMYMGGEPSIVGKKQFKAYINTVKKALPKAKHTVVTNLFNLPAWLINLSINEFDCQIETTYANGKKQTLSGNEARYQEKFVKNLTAVSLAGVNCTVKLAL